MSDKSELLTTENWYSPNGWNAIPAMVVASLKEHGVFYARVGSDGVIETVHPDQIVRVSGSQIIIDPARIQINDEDNTITVSIDDVLLVEEVEAVVLDPEVFTEE